MSIGVRDKVRNKVELEQESNPFSHGVKLIADFVPLDTRVRLNIQLSDKAADLSALGNVRWAHKLDNVDLYEIGIKFDDVSPDFTHALQKHINQRLESGWGTV